MKTPASIQRLCHSVLFYFVVWYALWTIGSNWISLTAQDSEYLVYWFFISAITGVAGTALTWKKFFTEMVFSTSDIKPQQINASKVYLLVLFFMGLLLTMVTYKFQSAWLFFLGFGAIAITSYYFLLTKNNETTKLPLGNDLNDSFRLLFLIITLIFLYSFGHQPDGDDANFINLALGAFRSEAGVFALDTMLGDGPTSLHLPTYRVHSFELLFGTLGHIFPGEALFYAHCILPLIFTCLFSVALYLIYRPLFGNNWLLPAFIHLIVLVASLEGYRSLGAHGFFRFFQGKIFFIQVLAPLVVYSVIACYRNLNARMWFFLLCLQICGVGFTANAIYAAPLAVGLTIFPFCLQRPVTVNNSKKVLIILLSCIYPVLMGLIIILKGSTYPSQFDSAPNQAGTIFSYFGWNPYGLLMIAVIPVCFYVCSRYVQKDYPVKYMFGVLFFIFNPLLWPVYSYVTGNLNFRVYWAIPFVPLLAISMSSILLTLSRRFEQWLQPTLLPISILILFLITFDKTVLREGVIAINWRKPSYRVVQNDFKLAHLVAKKNEPTCKVLVPSNIAHHLTMIENHPYPIAVSKMYQTHYRHTMNLEERNFRSLLLNSVSNHAPGIVTENQVATAIKRFNICSILTESSNINIPVFDKISRKNDFKEETVGKYTFYHRSGKK